MAPIVTFVVNHFMLRCAKKERKEEKKPWQVLSKIYTIKVQVQQRNKLRTSRKFTVQTDSVNIIVVNRSLLAL